MKAKDFEFELALGDLFKLTSCPEEVNIQNSYWTRFRRIGYISPDGKELELKGKTYLMSIMEEMQLSLTPHWISILLKAYTGEIIIVEENLVEDVLEMKNLGYLEVARGCSPWGYEIKFEGKIIARFISEKGMALFAADGITSVEDK